MILVPANKDTVQEERDNLNEFLVYDSILDAQEDLGTESDCEMSAFLYIDDLITELEKLIDAEYEASGTRQTKTFKAYRDVLDKVKSWSS